MQLFFKMLLLASLYLLPCFAAAQEEVIGDNELNEAVTWTFNLIQKDARTYELQAHAGIKPGFHLWSVDPGGDGTLISTDITLADAGIKWQGKWEESIAPKVRSYDFIDGAVRYFDSSVTFSRTLTGLAPNATLSGSVDFQTCNEQMCFPPETIDFTVRVKKP